MMQFGPEQPAFPRERDTSGEVSASLDGVEVTVYRREGGGIGVQVDTAGLGENAWGPAGLAVMLNDADVYVNVPGEELVLGLDICYRHGGPPHGHDSDGEVSA